MKINRISGALLTILLLVVNISGSLYAGGTNNVFPYKNREYNIIEEIINNDNYTIYIVSPKKENKEYYGTGLIIKNKIENYVHYFGPTFDSILQKDNILLRDLNSDKVDEIIVRISDEEKNTSDMYILSPRINAFIESEILNKDEYEFIHYPGNKEVILASKIQEDVSPYPENWPIFNWFDVYLIDKNGMLENVSKSIKYKKLYSDKVIEIDKFLGKIKNLKLSEEEKKYVEYVSELRLKFIQ